MDVRQHKAKRAHGFCVWRPRAKRSIYSPGDLIRGIAFVQEFLDLFALTRTRPVGPIAFVGCEPVEQRGDGILLFLLFILFFICAG